MAKKAREVARVKAIRKAQRERTRGKVKVMEEVKVETKPEVKPVAKTEDGLLVVRPALTPAKDDSPEDIAKRGDVLVVGDLVEYWGATERYGLARDNPEYKDGTRGYITRLLPPRGAAAWIEKPGAMVKFDPKGRDRVSFGFRSIATGLRHDNMDWMVGYDLKVGPIARVVRMYREGFTFKYQNLILPIPQEADKVTLQIEPTPRIVAHFPERERVNVAQALETPAIEFSFKTPPLAMSMEIPIDASGYAPHAMMGQQFFIWGEDRSTNEPLMAPYVWGNVNPTGSICWGHNNPPGNLRSAWSAFWSFPTNEHLTNQFRVHAADCKKIRPHDCKRLNGITSCHPKHTCDNKQDNHHKCENFKNYKSCNPGHKFPRFAGGDERVIETALAVRDNRLVDEAFYRQMHHFTSFAELEKFQKLLGNIDWKHCYCLCCIGSNGYKDKRAYCQCGVKIESDCGCCNRRCDCLRYCRCCSGYCACKTGCPCCDGVCKCVNQGCTCKLGERFVEFLKNYKPSNWRNVKTWLHGTKSVQFGKTDALFMSDDAEVVKAVPEKYRTNGIVVGTAKRYPAGEIPGWRVDAKAEDGGTFSLLIPREDVKVCV